ncbi:hypothetical protein [Streptomyces sp. NBC_01089]|uniref:hypothetical protein n=1 Tax=Streptomyces sp. NBC_01089 TaxID=2903747 RepID=UPI003867813F
MPGIDECLLEAMRLPGSRGAAVVDWTSGLALGTIGESPNNDHEATAAETAELARMAAEHQAFAPDPAPDPDPAPAASAPAPTGVPADGQPDAPTGGDGPADGPPGADGAPGASAPIVSSPAVSTPAAPAGLPVEDVIVTNRTGYHILRFVETTFDSSVFLHLWLDRDEGNLALARLRLRDLAERLVL